MKQRFPILCCLIVVAPVWLCGSVASGANVELRERAILQGSVLRLADIADLSGGSLKQLADLAATSLLTTPAPGSRLFLSGTQIRDLLQNRGIDTGGLIFEGAAIVEVIRSADSPQIAAAPQEKLTLAEIETAVVEAIETYLRKQTGHSLWSIRVNLQEMGSGQRDRLGSKLLARGGRSPWKGEQEFHLFKQAGGSKVVIHANVNRVEPAVVALRSIGKGELIRSSDVELRMQQGNVSPQTVSTLSQVVGMQAQRTIRADELIRENQLRAPTQVSRGETVSVIARTAGIAVRTYATAKQDGALGELVQVETLEDKQRLVARVVGRGELEVHATGALAEDYAGLRDRRTYSR